MRWFIPLAAAVLAAAPALAHDGKPHGAPRIVGPVDAYAFPLPEPGSYALPPLGPAPDATLLDETGATVRLAETFDGSITVLAFVYTRCADICPLTHVRMSQLADLATGDPVAARLDLVSLSFDPAYDTPAEMMKLAMAFRPQAADAPRWQFLTAPDEATIAPVLAAYGQPVAAKSDPDDPMGPYSHLLRVFLIDGAGAIRNIYSADFLDPRLILNDVRTLAREAEPHVD